MKKYLLLIIVFSALLLSGCADKAVSLEDNSKAQTKITPTGITQEFEIKVGNWYFEPNTISANLGDQINIKLIGEGGRHSFAVSEFDVDQSISEGETKDITFFANKKGMFVFYCAIPCGQGHSTMRGKLIIR